MMLSKEGISRMKNLRLDLQATEDSQGLYSTMTNTDTTSTSYSLNHECQNWFLLFLQNNELPSELLTKLQERRVQLLPRSWSEMKGSCTCPDNPGPGNPCKHLAAVYHIITTEIDQNPFTLFQVSLLFTRNLLLGLFIFERRCNADSAHQVLFGSRLPFETSKLT